MPSTDGDEDDDDADEGYDGGRRRPHMVDGGVEEERVSIASLHRLMQEQARAIAQVPTPVKNA